MSKISNCSIVTDDIRKLAEKFPDEKVESVNNLVGLWREKNNKSMEAIPTEDELRLFIQKIRGNIFSVTKIISGGQTGVDTIGLQVAKELGIETGGTAPKGFLRERGIDNEDISSYNLKEITDEEQADYTKRKGKSDPYTGRTELNVRNSDGTVYFYTSDDKAGMIATKRSADDWNKPFITNPTAEELREWINTNGIKTLNVAGNRGSKLAKNNNVAEVLRNALFNNQVINPSETRISANDNSFSTPEISNIQEQQKVDLLFDPQTRRDRVSLIARLFSSEIDFAVREYEENLRNRLENSEDDTNELRNKDKAHNEEIYSKIKKAKSGDEIAALRSELTSIDRWSVVNKYTPGGIFNRVLSNVFLAYTNDTEENRVQQMYNEINTMKGAEKYSTEKKMEAAKKRADHKYQEYLKIIDTFKPLAEEAASIIKFTEKVRVDPNYIQTSDVNMNDDDPEGNSNSDNRDDEMSQEESAKDGWMTNFREVSSHESLSQAVRKVISKVPKLDYRGRYEKDDLGNTRYLDADYVHATFIDKLRFMIDSSDMIPLMQELAKEKAWVKQVIKLLQNDDTLFSQFYQDFRKDFASYWIQKRKMQPDGTFKMETISINTPEGISYLLDSWRDNYENGIKLDDNSVYEKDGTINKKNAEVGTKLVRDLNSQLQNLSTEERLKLLETEDVWNRFMKALHMIGIDANPAVLRLTLSNIKKIPGMEITDPVISLLYQLNVIFSGITKDKIKSEVREDGSIKRGDLINTFGAAYANIANMIAEVTEDAIESSVRENDKSYYSHVTPSYLGKLMKNLKNVRNDKERFDKFMQTEFKDYEWFFKNGEWRNDWLRQLAESEDMRKNLNHKILLNSDKIDYSNWDDLDCTLVLLTEYWSDPESSNSNTKYAWFHVPILSDSPSAEFIRFRKYTTGDEFDDYGRRLSYDDIIIDRLADLVNQEYDRIMLVRERDDAYQNNIGNVEPIASFDISRDSFGNIKSLGGAEFKFLPALNSLVVTNTRREDFEQKIRMLRRQGNQNELARFINHARTNNTFNETFLNKLSRLREYGTGDELRSFIKESLRTIMEDGFEETFSDWCKIGLLDELPNCKYKYLSYKISEGQSRQNKATANTLNKAKELLNQLGSWSLEMESLLNDISNNRPYDTRRALATIDQIKEALINGATEGAIPMNTVNGINEKLVLKNNAKEALREYYYNSKLATSQIIELTTTDLAFYKNLEDFQKRYKEVHAPSLRMNTKAVYNGERIGRDWERTIYLQDDEIVSSVLEDIKTVIMEKHKNGVLSDYNAASILSKFGYSNHVVKDKNGKEKKYAKVGNTMIETSYVNVADAQAYRSLGSYRAMLGMSGQWTDEMEKAYNNFKNGNWDMNDFNIIWQTKKPYVYTQVNNDSGVSGHTGIKTPVQHKNSEFLLLAMYDGISGSLGKSSKLRAINKFMEDHQIDVVQFESTTKVGKQGTINLNDVESEEDVTRRLEEATGVAYGKENPNVVHKISYEDYGIQTATPEHGIDAIQLVGTQIRKLITADISPDAIITINGKSMTKQEWIDLYNKINTENILQAFSEVDRIFSDPKEVEKILQEEIRGNQRYGIDMLKACTLDENGNFNIPLADPVQSQRVQTLLNSIIRSRVTKQKIRGGALIQVSDYGLTSDLSIVFKDKDGNLMSWDVYSKKHRNATREEYESFVNQARKNGHLSIAYLECYMPAYSREFYEPLMDPETHVLDINKKGADGKPILSDDLRKLIGYRVPTEDKYSMAPLYIKGFLPQQNGSAIMLPSEITTLSGSDFDVDKMYIMLPEFYVSKYDMESARRDYAKIDAIFNKVMSQFTHSQLAEDILNADTDNFKEWFEENKEKYKSPKIRKIRYDFNKSPKDNGLKARNNLLIDMMYGVLTNEDTASKILNPGGFDDQKKAARIMSILNASYESDLYKTLKDLGIEFNQTITRDGKSYKKSISAYLFDLDLNTLNKLADKLKDKLDPLSPRTQVVLHQQNMTGAKLIGIYANHNANHALMQHTNLALNPGVGSFKLNGKELTSLSSITNDNKEFISKNNAGYLAASVDNVKDPVLAALNQNTFTADATMLLSRLGYSPLEVGLLMMQPIVQEITNTYFRESREGKSKETIINKILAKYRKLAGISAELTYDNYKNYNFYNEELADNIILAKEVNSSMPSTPDRRKNDFYSRQVAVGYLFQRVMTSADALGNLVQATRADTQGGAAGPTIADTMIKIQKVTDFLVKADESNFPLKNANVMLSDLIDDDDYDIVDGKEQLNYDKVREKLLRSPLPFLQAFYTLGVERSANMLRPYFPQFTAPFRKVIDSLRDMTKSGKLDVKTMNSIYNDLFAYIMSKNPFFGTEVSQDSDSNNVVVTSAERRRDFINHFPEYFKKVVSNNEDIADLEFIKRLRVINANDTNPVETLIFKNVGRISSILRERYMRDWSYLLYMRNPEAQKLALNLFRYSYYRNGFAFGPNTFVHLAPVILREVVPDYISTLRSLMDSEDDYDQFVDQYVYNHLDNRRLVPEIPDTSSISFIDDNGNIKDTVFCNISSESSSDDRKAVKQILRLPDGDKYEFFNYICRKINGKYVYYKLTASKDGDIQSATYERIEPLGYRNSFIEYEYGKDVMLYKDLKDIRKKRMLSMEEAKKGGFAYVEPNNSFIESTISKNDIDYDAYSQTLSKFDNGEDKVNDDSSSTDIDRRNSLPSAEEEAFKKGYGVPLDNSVSDDSVISIQPNTEYRDENGEKPCI